MFTEEGLGCWVAQGTKDMQVDLKSKVVEFMPTHFKSFWLQVVNFKSTLSHFAVKWGQIEPLKSLPALILALH